MTHWRHVKSTITESQFFVDIFILPLFHEKAKGKIDHVVSDGTSSLGKGAGACVELNLRVSALNLRSKSGYVSYVQNNTPNIHVCVEDPFS